MYRNTISCLITISLVASVVFGLTDYNTRYYTGTNQVLPAKGSCSPCNCQDYTKCPADVDVLIDGCKCCMMCARQQGDRCNHIQRCQKGLKCDMTYSNYKKYGSHGVCRATSAKSCMINGRMYKDGNHFKPNCGTLCTCQNGNYGCVSLCPQHRRKPRICPSAQLVRIGGKCCKEWVCQRKKPRSRFNKQKIYKTGLTSSKQSWPKDEAAKPAKAKQISGKMKLCKMRTTSWSACSTSCDFGISIRQTNDNAACRVVSEVRLCLIRPCKWNVKHRGKKCTPTIKASKRMRFFYNGCVSVKTYKPKYCSKCRARKCCIPENTKIKPMVFKCAGGKKQFHNFMWIKKCKCHRC